MINVLIPCYNDQEGLHNTLKSLNESSSLHVFIIDDGSKAIINIKNKDIYKSCIKKITIKRFDENKGLINALNYGIDLIQSHYGNNAVISRIDCGDLALKNCFTDRLKYFDDTNMRICGSWCHFQDKQNYDNSFVWKGRNEKPSKYFPLNTNYIHSGVMLRPEEMRYSHDHKYCEDVMLFFLLEKKGKGIIHQEKLIRIIQNDNGISTQNRTQQIKSYLKVLYKDVFAYKPILTLIKIIQLNIYLLLRIDKASEINIKRLFR